MQALRALPCLDERATRGYARKARTQTYLWWVVCIFGLTFTAPVYANTPDAIVYLVVGHLTLLVILVVLLTIWPIAWRRKLVVFALYLAGLVVAVFFDSFLVHRASWVRLGLLFAVPLLGALIGAVLTRTGASQRKSS